MIKGVSRRNNIVNILKNFFLFSLHLAEIEVGSQIMGTCGGRAKEYCFAQDKCKIHVCHSPFRYWCEWNSIRYICSYTCLDFVEYRSWRNINVSISWRFLLPFYPNVIFPKIRKFVRGRDSLGHLCTCQLWKLCNQLRKCLGQQRTISIYVAKMLKTRERFHKLRWNWNMFFN